MSTFDVNKLLLSEIYKNELSDSRNITARENLNTIINIVNKNLKCPENIYEDMFYMYTSSMYAIAKENNFDYKVIERFCNLKNLGVVNDSRLSWAGITYFYHKNGSAVDINLHCFPLSRSDSIKQLTKTITHELCHVASAESINDKSYVGIQNGENLRALNECLTVCIEDRIVSKYMPLYQVYKDKRVLMKPLGGGSVEVFNTSLSGYENISYYGNVLNTLYGYDITKEIYFRTSELENHKDKVNFIDTELSNLNNILTDALDYNPSNTQLFYKQVNEEIFKIYKGGVDEIIKNNNKTQEEKDLLYIELTSNIKDNLNIFTTYDSTDIIKESLKNLDAYYYLQQQEEYENVIQKIYRNDMFALELNDQADFFKLLNYIRNEYSYRKQVDSLDGIVVDKETMYGKIEEMLNFIRGERTLSLDINYSFQSLINSARDFIPNSKTLEESIPEDEIRNVENREFMNNYLVFAKAQNPKEESIQRGIYSKNLFNTTLKNEIKEKIVDYNANKSSVFKRIFIRSNTGDPYLADFIKNSTDVETFRNLINFIKNTDENYFYHLTNEYSGQDGMNLLEECVALGKLDFFKEIIEISDASKISKINYEKILARGTNFNLYKLIEAEKRICNSSSDKVWFDYFNKSKIVEKNDYVVNAICQSYLDDTIESGKRVAHTLEGLCNVVKFDKDLMYIVDENGNNFMDRLLKRGSLIGYSAVNTLIQDGKITMKQLDGIDVEPMNTALVQADNNLYDNLSKFYGQKCFDYDYLLNENTKTRNFQFVSKLIDSDGIKECEDIETLKYLGSEFISNASTERLYYKFLNKVGNLDETTSYFSVEELNSLRKELVNNAISNQRVDSIVNSNLMRSLEYNDFYKVMKIAQRKSPETRQAMINYIERYNVDVRVIENQEFLENFVINAFENNTLEDASNIFERGYICTDDFVKKILAPNVRNMSDANFEKNLSLLINSDDFVAKATLVGTAILENKKIADNICTLSKFDEIFKIRDTSSGETKFVYDKFYTNEMYRYLNECAEVSNNTKVLNNLKVIKGYIDEIEKSRDFEKTVDLELVANVTSEATTKEAIISLND